MTQRSDLKNLYESFGRIFTTFGEALSEFFNDPELKAKAKELGSDVAASANILADRFKDKEVKDKFAQIALAVKEFGSDLVNEAEDLLSKIKEAETNSENDKEP
ncbi:MAG: hypothetical protein PHS35_00750 [Dehalococcoidales bacterium]|nr:hypothetical protein [Dehalococcoidales bacterium]